MADVWAWLLFFFILVSLLVMVVSSPENETLAIAGGYCKSVVGDVGVYTALAKVESEKRLALIKAWEDNEKAKAENKAFKKLSAVGSWENTKKATIDAELRQIQTNIHIEKHERGCIVQRTPCRHVFFLHLVSPKLHFFLYLLYTMVLMYVPVIGTGRIREEEEGIRREDRKVLEAKKREDILKVEETAAKFRATGNLPKKFLACFGY
ncbi:hypothetical protein K7X08_029378 [Anisodus acutangulus]|uniref:Remorin C-terminal domain-containing protein n=1 Tax=Anisodus acutangulus TaxID=402998 RepID=A0A9Q1L4H5_9SOLA|nr:hypothetical protein K7X08_029378 [Anisodus acutangulus]